MRTRKFLAAVALLIATAIPVLADDATRIYGRLLSEADTVQQKYAVAMTIASKDDPDAAPFVADALDWVLAARSTIKLGPERETYERLTRVLLKSLGDWHYTNAAASVMRTVDDSPDALTKAEALIALGSMRAVEYAERISLLLRDLNNQPAADSDYAEKVAYGCVLALERMRSPVGFAPLFFASEGWYSRRVRDQAERSLPLVLDDPSDVIASLLSVETPARMVKALDLELRSKAPVEARTRIAALALSRGVIVSPRNRIEQNQLAELRSKSMNALSATASVGVSTAADVAEAYRIAATDERLMALKALGADKSAPAAGALRDIILALNSDQKAGLVDDTRNTLMRAALQNAARNAGKDLAPAIQSVLLNDGWSSGILTLASAAQAALQK